MIVYLLVAVLVREPAIGPKIVDIQTMVFKSAARCLRNAEHNRKHFQNKYDQVKIDCTEKRLE